jgi:hypothetical protein
MIGGQIMGSELCRERPWTVKYRKFANVSVKAISAWMGNPDASCSATRWMAGQRHPDGRSLRVIKMAWRLRSDKRFLPRLGGDGMSGRFGIGQIAYLDDQSREPMDLCITQARYTQLHRLINNSQGGYSFIV